MYLVRRLLRWAGRLALLIAVLAIVVPEIALLRTQGFEAAWAEPFGMADVLRKFATLVPGLLLLGLAGLVRGGSGGRRRRRRPGRAVPGAGVGAGATAPATRAPATDGLLTLAR